MSGNGSPSLSSPTKPKYQLTFDTTFIDIGKVRKGEKRECTFGFQNTGTDPVVIDFVSSCECTTLTWPEGKVIKPGMRDQIHVVFDSAQKDESETIDIDVILLQKDEKGNQIFYILKYKYELTK